MPIATSTSERPHPRQEDIDRSPVYLLASLFSAKRSGDYVLQLLFRDRLKQLGIHVTFSPTSTAEASVPTTPPQPRQRKAVR